MSFLKKHAEIIFSYVIGIVALLTSIIIFINLPLIHKLNDKQKTDFDIHTVWDFIMAFFKEIIRVMSRFIGDFPIISAVAIFIFGLVLLYIGHTLRRTTRYDYDISIFFLVIGILFFIITVILMTQVYSFFAIIFVFPFVVHIGYIIYKDELNPNHKKQHFLWIIFSYGISYMITQMALYSRIETNQIKPIDILSIDTFFVIMWLLGQMAIWNFLFLRRSLPLTKEELGEIEPELSRSSKYSVSSQTKEHLKELQTKTTELTRKTRRSVDIQRIREVKDKIKNKIEGWINLEEDDIPSWMRKPKWFKPTYVEIACGAVLLFFTLIEFNNRNGLFISGEWKLSQTQYVYEWISLFLLMLISITYIVSTIVFQIRGRGYYLQLFMISLLFFKLLTEFINIMLHGLLLSIFITPILFMMLVAVVFAFAIQLRTSPRKL